MPGATPTGAVWLDIVRAVGPALLALLGVWLGSGLTRGRERRSWSRDRLVSACADFASACSSVEQWASSDAFAARLGSGQHPTDYKNDLAGLAAALAALTISAPALLGDRARDADGKLHAYVDASAAHQSRKPSGAAGRAEAYRKERAGWDAEWSAVTEARTAWTDSRAVFLADAREHLDKLR